MSTSASMAKAATSDNFQTAPFRGAANSRIGRDRRRACTLRFFLERRAAGAAASVGPCCAAFLYVKGGRSDRRSYIGRSPVSTSAAIARPVMDACGRRPSPITASCVRPRPGGAAVARRHAAPMPPRIGPITMTGQREPVPGSTVGPVSQHAWCSCSIKPRHHPSSASLERRGPISSRYRPGRRKGSCRISAAVRPRARIRLAGHRPGTIKLLKIRKIIFIGRLRGIAA
jgi:hypothetical protein